MPNKSTFRSRKTKLQTAAPALHSAAFDAWMFIEALPNQTARSREVAKSLDDAIEAAGGVDAVTSLHPKRVTSTKHQKASKVKRSRPSRSPVGKA